MQTPHQVAQKFTAVTLPRSAEIGSVRPSRVVTWASIGGRCGRARTTAKTPIATRPSATISFVAMFMRRAILATVLLLAVGPALAQLESITRKDATAALKAALEKGSQAAVASLGRQDGFLANPKVKIPLPESLQRAEKTMRRFGMGKYADELIVTMNRAAEAAVPEARQLFVESVKKMTVQDAKAILTGGDTAGTAYFRKTTSKQLHARFLPIVKKSTEKVGLAQKYNEYAEKGAAFGLIDKQYANLDEYVTQRALAGLFLMVAEEEKKIRKDPVGTGTAIIKKVFGALL
jgi:hypothetical protein